MAALVEAAREPDYPAEIAVVISNRPDAAGLVAASQAGIPAQAIDHAGFADRLSFERDLDRALRTCEVDFVCLAGFMRVFTPWFIGTMAGADTQHSSLAPALVQGHADPSASA
jgi:phosphoribosylglycinamide formyltransferase-1